MLYKDYIFLRILEPVNNQVIIYRLIDKIFLTFKDNVHRNSWKKILIRIWGLEMWSSILGIIIFSVRYKKILAYFKVKGLSFFFKESSWDFNIDD